MKVKNYTRIVFALALCCASLFGQTVTSTVVGTVVDPADAVVANAPVTLTSTESGAVRTGTSTSDGSFRFGNVDPGTYTLTIKASGFKTINQTGIVVAASETHALGNVALQIGATSESVSVTAEIAQIQLSSSEKAQTVDSVALDNLTLKGRDLFGYMRLVPGVIDTLASRDVTSPNGIGNITINGNTSAKNFTVDGITDMDTGSNGTIHYEPNLDAIQELKVLTSNYQAEFGRNSGGTISVITKNGTQQFHGTAAWNHRHEEFNANSWANNHTLKNINGLNVATPRVPYRYNVETYSIGGPVFIPKVFNREKKKLFFFWSQEKTGQFVAPSAPTTYTPTALERIGDFSQSFNNNGSQIKVLDPFNNNIQFPGNIIPSGRINPIGQALLNYFPLPNFTPTLASQLNVDNYFEQGSAPHPRRNDVLRIDTYLTSKISGYFRWIRDADDMQILYSGVSFSGNPPGRASGLPAAANIDHPNPGHGYAGTATWTITPTLINEVTVGESWNTWSYYSLNNYADSLRSLEPNLPTLFPIPTAAQNGPQSATNGYLPLLPTFTFGTPSNIQGFSRSGGTTAGAEENFNPIWTYQDNLSKIVGKHAFKMGIYLENNHKSQPASKNYNGTYNFASSTSIPLLNTNDGLANALLGNVNSYQQTNATTTFNVQYWNAEFYFQDNWKVSRRLTLDLGLRMYHQTPQIDLNQTFVNFNPSLYNKTAISRIYVPFCSTGPAPCNSNTGLVAKDPGSNAVVGSGFIGDYVPNSGNPATGLQNLGVNGVSPNPYTQAALAYGPRVGFAYDVAGDGKTAIRGGWGMFYNRLDGNQVYPMSGQAPTVYTQQVNTVTFAQIAAQNTGAAPSFTNLSLSPLAPSGWSIGKVPFDVVQNASLDVQRNVGKSTVIDVGYTFNWGYNQVLNYNMNYIPIGAGWPFNGAALDPTTGGNTSNGIAQYQSGILQRTLYPGYNGITTRNFLGHTNYNALTATINRRLSHGLAWGATYTFSKGMGTTSFTPAVPNNEAWNYGPLSSDRRNNLQINYNYDIPGIAKKYGIKGLGMVTDHWALSGITSFQSGAPYNPSCSLTSGAASVTGGYTGTPDLTQRCNVLGNPLANPGTNGNGTMFFDPTQYAMAGLATGPNNSMVGPPVLGNQGGGAGALTLPHVTNFDLTMTKSIPLGSERRVLKIQAQAYNLFNHTEISGLSGLGGTGNTNVQFNPTTGAVSNLSSVGYINGALPNRVLAFSARLQF